MKIIPLQQRGIAASRVIMGCMPFGGRWNRDPLSRENKVLDCRYFI
ncbi:hypothetical protein SAMN05421578_1702 [Paenibacillus macquariensis]|uniref:Aldo/keto reductase family protein n=1 Tax=Paenibacillus macquariensis TaxID=948756 RepID=A0ABY1KFA7_9BACL|nr:hypothetical protein SAMN05421578_1702 [Paenibacillus macquariensis]